MSLQPEIAEALLTNFLVYLSPAIALGAVFVSYLIYRIHTRRHLTESLFRVADRLERSEKRELKKTVYSLNRADYTNWSDQTVEDVNAWGAELDLLALLLLAEEIDMKSFFNIIGDVLIRSIYLMAPYINSARRIRGRQFLQPLGNLAPLLHTQWKKECNRRGYPDEIGLPNTGNRLSLEAFMDDEACRLFMNETRSTKYRFMRWRY